MYLGEQSATITDFTLHRYYNVSYEKYMAICYIYRSPRGWKKGRRADERGKLPAELTSLLTKGGEQYPRRLGFG